MEQLEFEGMAEALLREGGQGDEGAPRLAALVASLLGPDGLEYAPTSLPGDAALVRIRDTWRIYVRRKLPVERRAFAIAHELAEWWLRVRERYDGDDAEIVADYTGAAIMTPRRAFARSLRDHGDDFPELAADFRTTETHVALRQAELTGQPRVVVSPLLVRVRGPEDWVWPAEATLRGWVSKRGSLPGIRKVRLTDDPRRFVLDLDDVEAR